MHIARVESDHKSEPPGWFHILSAQAQIILPDQDCIGPVTNGVIALGKVPAGLQMHVDIPDVRQTRSDFSCSTWEHEDDVSVCGAVDRRIADLIVSQCRQHRARAAGHGAGSEARRATPSPQQLSASAEEVNFKHNCFSKSFSICVSRVIFIFFHKVFLCNSQQLSASAVEARPATIKLVLMLGSLQCSRQFFREIYGSIIYCCDEHVKVARHDAPALLHDGPQEHANAAQAPAVSEGRIRETAEDWWNTYRLEPSHAVHAFGNCRTPCHDFSHAACCPVLLPCLPQPPCPVTHVSFISVISFSGDHYALARGVDVI